METETQTSFHLTCCDSVSECLLSPCAPSSEDGGQFPDHHHDGDAGGGRRVGSQDSAQSSSQTHVQVPDSALTGRKGDRRTATVAVTCQTREGADAHTCQVGGACVVHAGSNFNSRFYYSESFVLQFVDS